MKLEDALLYLTVDGEGVAGDVLVERCGAFIAAGADVLEFSGVAASGLSRLVEVCREGDALAMVRDDPEAAVAAGADGVLLTPDGTGIGMARAIVGLDRLVGLLAFDVEQAALGVEVGVDLLVFCGGAGALAAFRGQGGVVLYAGGIRELTDAQGVIEQGVFRLCIDDGILGGTNPAGELATISRLLGRCV